MSPMSMPTYSLNDKTQGEPPVFCFFNIYIWQVSQIFACFLWELDFLFVILQPKLFYNNRYEKNDAMGARRHPDLRRNGADIVLER